MEVLGFRPKDQTHQWPFEQSLSLLGLRVLRKHCLLGWGSGHVTLAGPHPTRALCSQQLPEHTH